MNTKLRESQFELMRIISMLFIVLYHILVHGKILEHATGSMSLFLVFIESLILVHVNSFVLVSGYFQCKGKLKLGKAIKINNMTWFYKVVMMLVLVATSLIAKPDLLTRIHTYLPIDYGTYWFINSYLILYLISPILNKVISTSSKKSLQKAILILFIIICVLSTVTRDAFYNTLTGRSLCTFILLYFIGAYIRIYPISDSYFMKPFSNDAKRLIYFSIYLFAAIMSTFCWLGYIYLQPLGTFANEIGSILDFNHTSYVSPIIIIQTLGYFLFFSTFNFKNKFINKISSSTLGVYLISENIFLREMIYDKIGLTKITNITISLILEILIATIVIFIICTLIETLREKIFRLIYNSKIAKKNRVFYQNYFKKLGLNIEWG